MTLKKGNTRFVGELKTRKRKVAFLDVMENALCNISTSCKKIGISRNCFYEWMKSDEIFKTEVEELQESMIDFGETMLYKNVRDGKETSIIFYLKTKGKDRGYIERVENVNKNIDKYAGWTDEQINAEIKRLQDEQQ